MRDNVAPKTKGEVARCIQDHENIIVEVIDLCDKKFGALKKICKENCQEYLECFPGKQNKKEV